MNSRWNDSDARALVDSLDGRCPADLALRVYSARLLGAEPDLVLAGGGNVSLKGRFTTAAGEDLEALFVKASGRGMAAIEPPDLPPLDLARLRRLGALADLDDARLLESYALLALRPGSPPASIEALFHALVPARFVDHAHPSAILALSDRRDGAAALREALGPQVAVVPYAKAGFPLCLAVARALREHPGCTAVALEKHGLITWGDSARASYEAMVGLVTRAERWLAGRNRAPAVPTADTAKAQTAWSAAAPMLRGLLTPPSGDDDQPFRRLVLHALRTPEVLGFLARPDAKDLALAPPLTPDHLVRAKALPCWCDTPLDPANPEAGRPALQQAVAGYAAAYEAYLGRHRERLGGVVPADPLPRVLLVPGLGAVCAGASAAQAADVAAITEQALRVKALVADTGGAYESLSEDHLVDMEYAPFQTAKVAGVARPLAGAIALVTGAAGAIGAGVAEAILAAGAHVAVSDLAGRPLEDLAARLERAHPGRVLALPMDVTDEDAVRAAFAVLGAHWGGLDLVVVNAGIAHVAPLTELAAADFRRLERVNVEGALFTMAAAGRLFKAQATGGDIVMISTKNVFAPGAKFGAYSATKAAAHQLARIASLEMAELGVRVNMVAPDAVFGHGQTRSGLWAAVGPDRMKARGLDEKGLEEYYRSRNLLKARVGGEHVARAVLWFATRQTPTTGATLPVDGGLPDATPR